LPPITLGDVRPARISLAVLCPVCRRRGKLDPTSLSLPDDADMARVAAALRCEGCGRKGGMSAVPEMGAWIAWLRDTGQDARLPWCAAFYRGK